MSQESKAGHLPQLSKIRLLLLYVTMNRPGFSKPSKAKGQIPKEKYLKIFQKMSHYNRTALYNQDLQLHAFLIAHLFSTV